MLLKGKNHEAYNLGSDQALSMKELAYKIASFVEDTTVTIQNCSNENIKKNRYIPSIKKAYDQLGLSPSVSLDESINKMIGFYKELK
jgi:dTDP-glucose 4,6-dehydratase